MGDILWQKEGNLRPDKYILSYETASIDTAEEVLLNRSISIRINNFHIALKRNQVVINFSPDNFPCRLNAARLAAVGGMARGF